MKHTVSEQALALVEKRVPGLGGNLTPQDAATATGVTVDEARDALARLMELYVTRVTHDDQGNLQFAFELPLRQRGSKTAKERWAAIRGKLWRGQNLLQDLDWPDGHRLFCSDAAGAACAVDDGLKAQDFRISEEGRPQVIDSIGDAEKVLLEIALLFDVSASTDAMFKFEQDTSAKFLQAVLRPDDRASVFTIGRAPVMVLGRDNAAKAIEALRAIVPTKEQTAFYDSVSAAANYLQKNSPQSHRKVIVVISDGEDTNSAGVVQAIWAAERKIADNVGGQELYALRVKARDTAKAMEQVKVLKALQDADAVLFSINPGGSSLQLNKMAMFSDRKICRNLRTTRAAPHFCRSSGRSIQRTRFKIHRTSERTLRPLNEFSVS